MQLSYKSNNFRGTRAYLWKSHSPHIKWSWGFYFCEGKDEMRRSRINVNHALKNRWADKHSVSISNEKFPQQQRVGGTTLRWNYRTVFAWNRDSSHPEHVCIVGGTVIARVAKAARDRSQAIGSDHRHIGVAAGQASELLKPSRCSCI